MNGLVGARVIVVDDEINEALPILTALARRGISAAYFDGKNTGLPLRSRLKGVRLAVLDMDIVGGGIADAGKISALAKVLEQILSPNNGPYIALIWTKHEELKDAFEDYLFKLKTIPVPIQTVMIEKAKCRKRNGDFSATIMSNQIQKALQDYSPLTLLEAWEGTSFDASTEVSNALSVIATSSADDLMKWRLAWKTQLLQLMYAIARAEAEQHLDADSCLIAFYGSLNPLYADRMETHTSALAKTFRSRASDILNANADCGTEPRAKINTMLHLALGELPPLAAGNIYTFSRGHKPKWVPTTGKLLEQMMQDDKNKVKSAENRKELQKKCLPVIIESSAACDHAQKNISIARFIVGLLVPSAIRSKLKKAGFIWELGPIYLDESFAKGPHHILFSARHVVALEVNKVSELKAFARLRAQAFIDLQAWFSHHVARPGMMLLREK